MLLLRPDRVVVAINDAARRTLGFDREELSGRRSDVLIAPDWWRRMENDWAVLLRSGSVAGDSEFVRADRRRMHARFAAQTSRLDGEQLVLLVILEQQLLPTGEPTPTGNRTLQLTRRELQVVARIASGQRVHELAADLGISPATAQTHVRNAMEKLAVRSQAQLVASALVSGQIEPEAVRSTRT